jgi:hypothetical protein
MTLFRSPLWMPASVARLLLIPVDRPEAAQFGFLTDDPALQLLLCFSSIVPQPPFEIESITYSRERFPISKWRCPVGSLTMYIMLFNEDPLTATVVFGGRAKSRDSVQALRGLQNNAICRFQRGVANFVWLKDLKWLNGTPDCFEEGS